MAIVPLIPSNLLAYSGVLDSTHFLSGDRVWRPLVAGGGNTVSGNFLVSGQAVATLQTTYTPAGTTQTINWNNGNSQILSLASATGNVTLTLTNPVPFSSYLLKVVQHSSISRNVIWPSGVSGVKWPGGVVPTITTTYSGIDMISLWYDGTAYFANIGQAYA